MVAIALWSDVEEAMLCVYKWLKRVEYSLGTRI